jgi:amino acid adenylation domain-containing protein
MPLSKNLERLEKPMCLLELFERNVSAAPDALAISSESRRLTYRELNFTADRIAEGMAEAGVGAGSLVGVLVERSPEMVAGLLGIWKAGGAFIPLDPATPADRVAFILEDAAPPFALTQEKFLDRLPRAATRGLLLKDLCARERPSSRCATTFSAEGLAYVTYTSGSTGKPKGARIAHGGVANTVSAVAQDLQLRPDDIVLAWSTIAFDVACLEIFLPLAFGASLFLLEKDASAGGISAEQIRRSGATVMFATPTMYRLLFEQGWQGDPKMQCVVGGEVLPLSLGIQLAHKCRSVWNQYGPTETSICATRTKIDTGAQRITIGHPLPNVSIHLLNQHLQPVPRGSVGEIYIGGAGVGFGYLHRDDLSRTLFLPDPFHDAPARLYKSGDLAIELADGSFDFLGRVDDQVKIRGFRVELGEIESSLRQCEGVQAAVVRAVEFDAGDRRLVAFIVGDETLLNVWKKSLRCQLPHYMVPAEFVSLRSFPVTANGKVDVQALDAMRLNPAASVPISNTSPIDSLEARLRAIWQRLLKVNTVELDQDFFALGGHSLLAERMLVQIEGWFGSRLPHSVLVEHPTIRRLAAFLRQNPKGQWPALVTLQAGAHQLPLFIAHGIGGSLLTFVELAAELGREQPVYGFQLPAYVDQHQAQIGELAANYVRQMRAIQTSGPYNLAGHSSGGLIVFEMACQLLEQGETVGLLALLDCDPNTGKHLHQPFRDWNSFKASLRRACAELMVRQFGIKELLHRRMVYQRIKLKAWLAAWLAAQSHRAGGPSVGSSRKSFLGAEGNLALAMRDYELRTYPGNAVLFIAQDEPGSNPEPAKPWTGKILGTCEIRFIPGTHQGIFHRPQVILLARAIRQKLTGEKDSGGPALWPESSRSQQRKQASLAFGCAVASAPMVPNEGARSCNFHE